MDLILMMVFCFLLYRVAKAKGLSPVSYIFNYIIMVVMVVFLLAFACISLYGPEILKTEQGTKVMFVVDCMAIFFEILLFYFFKRGIEKIEMQDEDDGETHPTPPNQKKDLSYFR